VSTTTGRFYKNNRLTHPAEFQAVFNSSFRSRDDLLIVLARRNSRDDARLGLAVSKKHIYAAVDRNKLKRIIRESFRHHQHQLCGIDIVVITYKPLKLCENPKIFNSLEWHWEKVSHCKKL
jgi:ribonuclease P protein component